MWKFWFNRYEPFAWLGLGGLLLSGAISKAMRGRLVEAVLNGVLAVAALVAGYLAFRKARKGG